MKKYINNFDVNKGNEIIICMIKLKFWCELIIKFSSANFLDSWIIIRLKRGVVSCSCFRIHPQIIRSPVFSWILRTPSNPSCFSALMLLGCGGSLGWGCLDSCRISSIWFDESCQFLPVYLMFSVVWCVVLFL